MYAWYKFDTIANLISLIPAPIEPRRACAISPIDMWMRAADLHGPGPDAPMGLPRVLADEFHLSFPTLVHMRAMQPWLSWRRHCVGAVRSVTRCDEREMNYGDE